MDKRRVEKFCEELESLMVKGSATQTINAVGKRGEA